MRRLTIASVFATLIFVTAGLSAAIAAPVNNPQAEVFIVECDDGETYEVVVGPGNAAHIVGSTSRLIPQSFTFEVIADGESVYEETETVGQGQKRGLQGRLLTCTTEIPVTEEEIAEIEEEIGVDLSEAEEVVILITVEVLKTPARR